jgi:hypothetical protein
LVDSAFRSRANAICASAVALHQQHPFPLTNFDPTDHPSVAQLTVVADYFSAYGAGPQTTRALAQLRTPTTGVSAWNHLMDLVNRQEVNAESQIIAARAGDASRFIATVHQAEALHPRIVSAGRAAGFSGSSPCGRNYG